MESALKNLQIHFNQLAAQLEWLRGTTECRLEQCDASEHPISAAGRRNPVAHYFQ